MAAVFCSVFYSCFVLALSVVEEQPFFYVQFYQTHFLRRLWSMQFSWFLQGVSIACYAEPCIGNGRDVCLSVTR